MRLLFEIDKKDYGKNDTAFIRPSVRAIIIKDKKIAMIHSIKYDYYKFPGGGVEGNEDYQDTLIREVQEETGMIVIPSSLVEYGMVHRQQKGEGDSIFIQDNYYYFCKVKKEVGLQQLDQYELDEDFTLEFVLPTHVIEINKVVNHRLKHNKFYSVMIERDTKVLEKLIQDGIFDI